MNNSGFVPLVAFMLGILCLFLGLALANPLKVVVEESMTLTDDGSGLDCSNSSISNQDKAVCTQIDLFVPLFTGLIFGIAGLFLGAIAFK